MKHLKLGLILAVILIFSISCEEEEEIEVKNLENAYIESATIINIPPYYWDNASSPDLILKLARYDNESNWEYATDKCDNVEMIPEILYFTQEIKITDEKWKLELVDYDDFNADDLIYERLVFNPYQDAENGVIPIYFNDTIYKKDGSMVKYDILVLELNYHIKK